MRNDDGKIKYIDVDCQDLPYNIGDYVYVVTDDRQLKISGRIKTISQDMQVVKIRNVNQHYRNITLVSAPYAQTYVYRAPIDVMPQLKLHDMVTGKFNLKTGALLSIEPGITKTHTTSDRMIVSGIQQEEYETVMELHGKIFGTMLLRYPYGGGEYITDFVQRGDVLEIQKNDTNPPKYSVLSNITAQKIVADFMKHER